MQVSVVESGHHKVSAEVDHLGLHPFQLFDFDGLAHCLNAIAAHRNRFFTQNRAEGRVVRHAGINVCVHENNVGLRLDFGRSTGGSVLGQARDCDRTQQNRQTPAAYFSHQPHQGPSCAQPHSPTPASASMVSKMRFSPSSRPLESNHSCKVCAPPPDPPPPMAIASCPSESGMLASVDALCTCAAFDSCPSTARTTCKIRAP